MANQLAVLPEREATDVAEAAGGVPPLHRSCQVGNAKPTSEPWRSAIRAGLPSRLTAIAVSVGSLNHSVSRRSPAR